MSPSASDPAGASGPGRADPGRADPGRASPRRMLWRGVRCRCPRCGGRGVLASWFRLADRCPSCGYRFQREEGFWLGAYVINFGVAEGLIGAVLFGYIIAAANHPHISEVPVIGAGLVAAILGPVLFFPLSRTVWSAIDLAMRPLEPSEAAEALLHISGRREGNDDGGD